MPPSPLVSDRLAMPVQQLTGQRWANRLLSTLSQELFRHATTASSLSPTVSFDKYARKKCDLIRINSCLLASASSIEWMQDLGEVRLCTSFSSNSVCRPSKRDTLTRLSRPACAVATDLSRELLEAE